MKRKKAKINMFLIAALTMILVAWKASPVYASDFTTASTISMSGTWSGISVLEAGATDYYKFQIASAGEVDFKVMSYINDICNYKLYDSDFHELSDKSVSYGSETSPKVGNTVYTLSQGTYYVAFSSFSKTAGNYRLCASFKSYGITVNEQDSYDSPQNLNTEKKVTGAITCTNTEDWYKVKISSAGKYRMTVSGFYAFECGIYDSMLTELHRSSIYGSDSNSAELELKAGTYYLQAKSHFYGKYTCQLSLVVPPKGEILSDTGKRAQYKVTKSGKTGGTVAYYKLTNGTAKTVSIPASVTIGGITYKVTSVAANAFKNNQTMTKVTVGKNVKTLETGAFSGCTKLKTVAFKSGSALTTIKSKAFYNCKKLQSISMPSNVKSIGSQAFYNCKNLKTITIKSTKLTAQKVGSNAFKGIYKKATIKVPGSKLNTYKKMLKKRGVSSSAKFKKY